MKSKPNFFVTLVKKIVKLQKLPRDQEEVEQSFVRSLTITMDLENYVCVLPGNSSDTLQLEDGFVWVEQKNRINYCNLATSSDEEQRRSEGTTSSKLTVESQIKQEQGAPIDDTFDFMEDDYDYHEDQYDSPVERVNNKKNGNNKLKSHKRNTKTINSPQEEAFNIDMFDEPTAEILKSIVSYSNYYTGNFGNIITKGQNSVVVYAYISKKVYPMWEPGAKPILIYATINNEYNKRYRNWRSEQNAVKVYKLSGDELKNQKIFLQVQKEKEHLCLLNKAKCNVPELRRFSRNVIVTSMVGMDGVTAPSIDTLAAQLRHSEAMYNAIIKDMKTWYKLHLIHGKVSSKNILFWNKEVYYIGWSHSVKIEHPLALKKLMKDCSFITEFFETRGVPVRSKEQLFKDITGLNEIDDSILKVSKDLWKSDHLKNPNRMPDHKAGASHTCSPRSCRFK